jgi:prepilin-type N-terminal cleavage/methylation domain-containing protein
MANKKSGNDRGFSLIEMVVVVAIIGIFIGMLLISVSSRWSAEAQRCAGNIERMVAKCRVFSMSREEDVILRVWQEGDNWIAELTGSEPEVVGKSKVAVEFPVGGISFQRSTGRLDLWNTEVNPGGTRDILIGKYKISIIALTGRHEMMLR